VCIKKMSESEPVDDPSLEVKRCQNRGGWEFSGQVWRQPVYCPDGSRCKDGMSLIQALIRNMGICPLMLREKTNA
jgi:hypothetical protein